MSQQLSVTFPSESYGPPATSETRRCSSQLKAPESCQEGAISQGKDVIGFVPVGNM